MFDSEQVCLKRTSGLSNGDEILLVLVDVHHCQLILVPAELIM